MTQKLLSSILKQQLNIRGNHSNTYHFNSANFFATTPSKRLNSTNLNKPRQYTEYCKLLELDTDFSSKSYKPPNEKDIRTAFRKQARLKHPDADSVPESTPDDAYYEIVQARDYLLENLNKTGTNKTPETNKPNAEPVVEWQAKEKLQKINTGNYGDIDFKFYPFMLLVLGFFGYVVWSSDLPAPDPKYPKWVDGRHERRKRQYELKEQKRIEKLERENFERELEIWRKKSEYEELDSCTGQLHPLTCEDDTEDIYIPRNYTSIMAFDNTVTGSEKSE